MWSHLIKIVSLGKGALVIGVAASAAMVSTAEFSNAPSHVDIPSPKPDGSAPGESQLSGLVKECVTKYAALRAAGDSASQGDRQSTSSVCRAAIEQSGLTSGEFATKYGLNALPAASTTDMAGLVKDCFEKYTAKDPGAGDACKKAIAASGLSSNDFFAKYGTPARPTTETRPAATPTAAPKTTVSTETYALIAKCLQLYTAIPTTSDSRAASDACAAAIKASGMSATEFWAKFGKELTSATKPAPTATPKPVTSSAELAQLIAKCLDLYKAITSTGDTRAVSEACGAAIRASGMTSADFWAKFHPATN